MADISSGKEYSHRLLRTCLGVVSALSTGILLTWSYYRAPLMALFPEWTTSRLSFMFSFHNMVAAATMAIASIALKKLSTRKIYVLAAVFLCIGLGGLYFLPENNPGLAYAMLFAGFGVVASIGIGMGSLMNYSIYPAWYPERPGTISGIMVMSFNCCAIVAGAFASLTIPAMGIRATLGMTGVLAALCLVSAAPLGVYPTKEQLLKLPPPSERVENVSAREYETKEALKHPAFYAVLLYHSFLFAVGLIFADHAANIASAFGAAALFGLLFSPAKGIACLFIGWLMDHLSTVGTMLLLGVMTLLSAGVMVIGATRSSALIILVGMVLCGFSTGSVSTIKAAAIRFYFGSRNYQRTYGIANLNMIISAGLTYVASLVLEKHGGSYTSIFVVIMVLCGAALLCTLFLHLVTKSGKR